MPTRRLLPAALCLTCLLAQQEGSKNIARTTVGRKVALVIGNRHYRHIPEVEPALADAADMAAALRRLGFDSVDLQTDLTGKQLIQAIGRFSRTQVSPGDLALVYYSGHGGMLSEENYLLPVDYEPPSDEDLIEAQGGFKMSKLRDIVENESRGARVRVLIFDACRSSPILAAKALPGGLGEMASRKPEGTFIAYASAHNQVSRYQIGDRNSYYTGELLKALAQPDRDLEEIFKQVRVRVYENTGGRQTPYLYGFLSKPLYLGKVPAEAVIVTPPVVTPPVGPRMGDSRRNPKDLQAYKYIPPGTFRMGCSEGDSECGDDEKPAHQVTITKGFWLGQTEVTVEAYRRYTQATGKAMPDEPKWGDRALNPAWRDGKMPIVNVSWDDSKSYCEWIGGRLPTEAEWEYAARGGKTAARYGALDDVAWTYANAGKTSLDPEKRDLAKAAENENNFHGVGLKAPNAFGLYDMLGNVWEWVSDYYGEKYYSGSENSDPQGPPNGQYRTLRGGSFFYLPRLARSSSRNRSEPGLRDFSLGFRCAWE